MFNKANVQKNLIILSFLAFFLHITDYQGEKITSDRFFAV